MNGYSSTWICNQHHWRVLVLANILSSSVVVVGVSTSQGGGLLETVYFFHLWELYPFPFRWKADLCSWYILALPCPSDRRCWTVSIAFQCVLRGWTSGWRCHVCVCHIAAISFVPNHFLIWANIALFSVGSSAQFNQKSSWTMALYHRITEWWFLLSSYILLFQTKDCFKTVHYIQDNYI